jgi:hypothetical protein
MNYFSSCEVLENFLSYVAKLVKLHIVKFWILCFLFNLKNKFKITLGVLKMSVLNSFTLRAYSTNTDSKLGGILASSIMRLKKKGFPRSSSGSN